MRQKIKTFSAKPNDKAKTVRTMLSFNVNCNIVTACHISTGSELDLISNHVNLHWD